MPASTRAMRLSIVDLEHPVHAETPTTTASSAGSAPPHSEVPAPRGTTLMPLSRQKRSTRATSLSCGRQHDRQRHPAVGGQAVGLERAATVLVADHRVGADQGDELLHDVLAAREHLRIRCGQGDLRTWVPP